MSTAKRGYLSPESAWLRGFAARSTTAGSEASSPKSSTVVEPSSSSSVAHVMTEALSTVVEPSSSSSVAHVMKSNDTVSINSNTMLTEVLKSARGVQGNGATAAEHTSVVGAAAHAGDEDEEPPLYVVVIRFCDNQLSTHCDPEDGLASWCEECCERSVFITHRERLARFVFDAVAAVPEVQSGAQKARDQHAVAKYLIKTRCESGMPDSLLNEPRLCATNVPEHAGKSTVVLSPSEEKRIAGLTTYEDGSSDAHSARKWYHPFANTTCAESAFTLAPSARADARLIRTAVVASESADLHPDIEDNFVPPARVDARLHRAAAASATLANESADPHPDIEDNFVPR